MNKSFKQIAALLFSVAYVATAIIVVISHFRWILDQIQKVWQDEINEGPHHEVMSQPIFLILFIVFVISLISAILIHKRKQCNDDVFISKYGTREERGDTTNWGKLRNVMIFVAVSSFTPAVIFGLGYIMPLLNILIGIAIVLFIIAIPPFIGFLIFSN